MIHPNKLKVYTIDYNEFEKLVKTTYSQDFNFCVDMECGNDSEHIFKNIRRHELSKWDNLYIENFIKTGAHSYITNVLLKDMVDKKVILPGNYLIEVSW